MREVVLDTETTGFDPLTGDRVVEIGAVELFNHLPTGRTFHRYLNPDREMPHDAFLVHGLSDDFLRAKPRFAEVADELIAFLGDAPMIAHNAGFDWKFLNAELTRCGRAELPWAQVIDTHAMAKTALPGATASLDALCQRFGVDNSGRDLHGALLDAQLLAGVYLELKGGRQVSLTLDAASSATGPATRATVVRVPLPPRPRPLPPRIVEAEAAAHAAFVARMGEAALWLRRLPG